MNINKLCSMFPNKKKRLNFLTQAILYFGLTMDSVEDIFGINKDELLKNLGENNPNLETNLYFMFRYSFKYQENAKEQFLDYLNSLYEAFLNKDTEKVRSLMLVFSDKDVIDLRTRKINSSNYRFSDEEIASILRFQLKYFWDTKAVCRYMKMDYNNYSKRVRNLGNEYNELVSYFDYLSDFYNNKAKSRSY